VQIRVNSVNPTLVLTEMGKWLWSDPAVSDPFKARIPLGKFAGMKVVTFYRSV
jgi:L-xylulose reductase